MYFHYIHFFPTFPLSLPSKVCFLFYMNPSSSIFAAPVFYMYGLYCNMINLPGATDIKRTDSPSPSNY